MITNYVNGTWVDASDAVVPMEDRGHQFGDGVYDVVAYFNRKLVDADLHLQRLQRSLRETRIAEVYDIQGWLSLVEELIERNEIEHGGVYIQVTRGVYRRDHAFPPSDIPPSITMSVFAQKTPSGELVANGCKVITQPDLRWKRCDIKTINLLPNLMAKEAALEAGAREALLVKENGEVSEGAVANVFMVKHNVLVTHPATNEILNGITRQVVLGLARELGIAIEERPFLLKEVIEEADELFLTSTTSNVLAINQVDDHQIGTAKAGPVALQLLQAYKDHIAKQTGYNL